MRFFRVVLVLLGLGILVGLAYVAGLGRETSPHPHPADASIPSLVDIGPPLYPPSPQRTEPAPAVSATGLAFDPIVIPDCRVAVFDKVDVPSQQGGILLFVGSKIEGPSSADPNALRADPLTGVKYRAIKENDMVQAGQLLAQVDNRLARSDFDIQERKIIAAKADCTATGQFLKESLVRLDVEKELRQKGAGSPQDFRTAQVTVERYAAELVAKEQAIKLAELERNKAKTILDMHEIRSPLTGVIQAIAKKPGESVRGQETVFQISNLDQVRIEGLVEGHYRNRLTHGQTVTIEHTDDQEPLRTFIGHLQEVTAVAVGPDAKKPVIVSASEDRSVRVWSREQRSERVIWWHPTAVRAVACATCDKVNVCLSGASDGRARLWNLDEIGDQPLRELDGSHRGAILCVAFTPDGRHCVSGGEDGEIHLYETATGQRRYSLPAAHRGAITSLQFTPQGQLISAGRDHQLCVWNLGTQGAALVPTPGLDRRSGDLSLPGVRPDGKQVLFDQGKALRLLSLPGGRTDGVMHYSSGAHNFSLLALYSPDARLILTPAASEGRLQLWRAPTDRVRGHELRQLVARERSALTSAAFAVDGSFVTAGTRDRHVLVWSLTAAQADLDRKLHAQVTLVDPSIESSGRQLRVWAEIANPGHRLKPGDTVTMVVYPK